MEEEKNTVVGETDIPEETSQDANVEETPAPDIEALLAEAERRGYERGRNDELRRRLASPDLWEVAGHADGDDVDDAPVSILNELRPCIWD